MDSDTTASLASTVPAKPIFGTNIKIIRRNLRRPKAALRIASARLQQLRERLRDFEQAGIDQVLCISQAGKIPHDLLCSSIELFSKEVLPEFKDRDLASGARQAERRARINEKALARKPKVEAAQAEMVIRAAGHH